MNVLPNFNVKMANLLQKQSINPSKNSISHYQSLLLPHFHNYAMRQLMFRMMKPMSSPPLPKGIK